MDNPWKHIPYEDYEGHMSHPAVDQLRVLGEIMREALELYRPGSLVLLGACTGNGLEHVDPRLTSRVVCVDINPSYLEVARQRYEKQLPGLQLICADLDRETPDVQHANLVLAFLLLEYLDPSRLMKTIAQMLAPGATTRILIQKSLPGGFVSKTGYHSLEPLGGFSSELDETRLIGLARDHKLNISSIKELKLNPAKKFIILDFVRDLDPAGR